MNIVQEECLKNQIAMIEGSIKIRYSDLAIMEKNTKDVRDDIMRFQNKLKLLEEGLIMGEIKNG